jgi:peptide/nickel transport system substrate-binding protein
MLIPMVFAPRSGQHWRSLIGGLFMVMMLAIAGCQPAQWRNAAAQGSSLTLATLTDPKTFNQPLNSSFPNIFLFTYEGLTRINGQTGKIEPALAESWTVSADQQRVVFTLRPHLKWSDGQPLTAADVVFTYRDVIFNPEVPAESKEELKIGAQGTFPTVRQLDDRRVEFQLPEPFAPLLNAVSAPDGVLILPKHALAAAIATKGSDGNLKFLSTWNTDTPPEQVVVNGPYRLESYRAGQRLVFRRNPYYWRDAQAGDSPNPPPSSIDRIVWQFIENTDTQLLRFRSGDLDVMGDARPLRPEYYSLLKREEKRGNFRVYNGGPWSGMLYLAFNQNPGQAADGKPIVDPVKLKWFTDVNFRRAIAYGLDRDRLNTNIFRGLGVPQHSSISVQSPYFLSPQAGLKTYDYNPQRSKELLRQSGFQTNAQGQLMDAAGNRVRFTLLTNSGNKVREAIGAQVKQDLGNLGIQVDFQPINFNTLSDRLNTSRNWDAHIIGFTGGIEPHSLANFWMTKGASHYFNLGPQPGQPPIRGWQPYPFEQEMDRFFLAGARELDPAKRKVIYADFQRLAQDQLPIIYLVNDSALMAVRNTISGLRYTGLPSWGLWNLPELRIQP